MHAVDRSPEPGFLVQLRTRHSQWSELDGSDRQRIRYELAQDFLNLCAYCEQECGPPTTLHDGTEESIEHFMPRHLFPDMWLDWLNLLYACNRCNRAKDNKWPTPGDDTDQLLARLDRRYGQVSEYVTPNSADGNRPSGECFDFDVTTGEIIPSIQLRQAEWSMAQRTIVDVNLNDKDLGQYDPNHLWIRRKQQAERLVKEINRLADIDERLHVIREFMLPDKPFSSFVAKYIFDRFPLIAHLP